MNWRRTGAIMRKEVAQILRDRRSLISIVMIPVIQLILYGFLSYDVEFQPMIVWDQSVSAESDELIRALVNTRYFKVHEHGRNMQDIQRALDSGDDMIGLVIPPDYAKLLRSGKSAEVLVVVDASDSTSARTVLSSAVGVGSTLSQRITLRTQERRGPAVSAAPRVDIRPRAWYNPDLQSQVFLIPGVLAVILQFTTTFLSVSVIVKERELGTFEQLVVTPIRQSELMLGKIVPLIGVGFVNMTFILFLGWAFFGVAVKGSLLLLYLATLAFFFSSLGLGTLISTTARTFQQATQMSQLILLPSILISGFLFPRETLPIGLQWVGQALPLTYFIVVVRGIIIKGVGIQYLWRQIALLFGLGIVVFAMAVRRFSKKLD
ncbi:MAG TPA: ABC transporter permease [Candidatus Xenobia bacterium]